MVILLTISFTASCEYKHISIDFHDRKIMRNGILFRGKLVWSLINKHKSEMQEETHKGCRKGLKERKEERKNYKR